jgi:hypothetical protein
MNEMRSRSIHSTASLIALVAGMAASTGALGLSVRSARHVEPRALRDAFGPVGSWGGRQRAKGWSVAADRRRAKKAKNVARNRKAHR